MSVEPESLGEPSEEADEYLKDANAEDPRDQQAPAHEPAGAEPSGDQAAPS